MNIQYEQFYKIVTPEEGLYLTDGHSVSDLIFMPLSADVQEWWEITEEEKIRIEEEVLPILNEEIQESVPEKELSLEERVGLLEAALLNDLI